VSFATNGQLVAANATLREWIGRDETTAAPSALADLLTPPSLLFFETQLRPLLLLGRHIDGAFLTLRHADGSSIPVVANAVQAAGKSIIDMALISVREREQYEAQLRASHQQAESALDALAASAHAHKMQAVGQMAAGIAHEFNNLLAVVRGNVMFAQQGLEAPSPVIAEVQQDLASALAATDRAVDTVRQLLAFTGQQIVERSRLNLNRVIEQGMPLLLPALGPDITWQQRLAPTLPLVFAASDQLQHVLAELVLNARDAIRESGKPGLITISTSTTRIAPDAREGVRLVITDTGSGMSADALSRAFDPFFTTKGLGRGTGLGLSMVYGAINALGGTTRLASTVGDGTQVIIELPAAIG
jgi:signal transduction histidine kinase